MTPAVSRVPIIGITKIGITERRIFGTRIFKIENDNAAQQTGDDRAKNPAPNEAPTQAPIAEGASAERSEME